MFYLVEAHEQAYGYILDTTDGVVEKTSKSDILKAQCSGINIIGAGKGLQNCNPCVPEDYKYMSADSLMESCTLCIDEIHTVAKGDSVTTKFAGFAIVKGNAGMSTLNGLVEQGVVTIREGGARGNEACKSIPIKYTAKAFSELPKSYLGGVLKFKYIFDDSRQGNKSVVLRMYPPYTAPFGLNKFVSMFDNLKFSDRTMSFWEMRKKFLSRGVVKAIPMEIG